MGDKPRILNACFCHSFEPAMGGRAFTPKAVLLIVPAIGLPLSFGPVELVIETTDGSGEHVLPVRLIDPATNDLAMPEFGVRVKCVNPLDVAVHPFKIRVLKFPRAGRFILEVHGGQEVYTRPIGVEKVALKGLPGATP